jgi:DMSO/TMAO reductase YedYZ molybdopterin-dependent catalytic subunit
MQPGRRDDDERPWGRRAFLGALGTGALAVAVGRPVWNAVSQPITAAAAILPQPVKNALPLDGWRIYAVNPPMPRFDEATFRLRVGGKVERPLELAWGEVQALDRVEQVSDFHCVTGWSVNDVGWSGFRLGPLLQQAGLQPGVTHLEFISLEDPYVDTLRLDQALLPDVLVADRMDGGPLTRAHGAPLRLVIPRMYGYKGVKWLTEIRATDRPQLGYWEARGYDTDAWVDASNGLG